MTCRIHREVVFITGTAKLATSSDLKKGRPNIDMKILKLGEKSNVLVHDN